MSDPLLAYLATLATLLLIFLAALLAGVLDPLVIGKLEAFGLGTITGGLIGALRYPARHPAEGAPVPGKVEPGDGP